MLKGVLERRLVYHCFMMKGRRHCGLPSLAGPSLEPRYLGIGNPTTKLTPTCFI